MKDGVNGCEPDSKQHRARTHGYLDCVVAVTMRADLDRKAPTCWRNYFFPDFGSLCILISVVIWMQRDPPTEIPLQVDLHLVAFLTPNTRNVGLEKLTGDSTQLGLSTSKRA